MKYKLIELLELSSKTPLVDRSAEIAELAQAEDPYIRQLVGYYKLREETLCDTLAACYFELDKQLPDIIAFITALVKDYGSAVDVRNNFNLRWFRQQVVSQEAKVEIAQALISICKQHLGNAVPSLWTALANKNNEVMASAMFTFDSVTAD